MLAILLLLLGLAGRACGGPQSLHVEHEGRLWQWTELVRAYRNAAVTRDVSAVASETRTTRFEVVPK